MKERKKDWMKERTEGVLYPYLRRPLPNNRRASGGNEWLTDWVTEKKSSFNFAENWLRRSSRYINVRNFRVLVKQLSYGNKIQFQVESWENFTKDFHVKKKVLWFCWNLAHIKFTIYKCAQFSIFGETTFLWEWNSISSLRFGKIFTKDFHVKKKLHGNSL